MGMGKGLLDWCRIVMNQDTKRIISTLPYQNMDVLEVSGKAWKKFGWKSYTSKGYPAFDLCQTPDEKNVYDIVIAEQVLEHVMYPYRALKTVHDLLRPGGYFLSTTPFLLKIHGCPEDNDFWRWTPQGKKLLFENSNFEVIELGQWGNKDCVTAYLNYETREPYDSSICSLENELDSPIMVWILGKKND